MGERTGERYFYNLYNVGKQEAVNLNTISLGNLVKNVYMGVEWTSM